MKRKLGEVEESITTLSTMTLDLVGLPQAMKSYMKSNWQGWWVISRWTCPQLLQAPQLQALNFLHSLLQPLLSPCLLCPPFQPPDLIHASGLPHQSPRHMTPLQIRNRPCLSWTRWPWPSLLWTTLTNAQSRTRTEILLLSLLQEKDQKVSQKACPS